MTQKYPLNYLEYNQICEDKISFKITENTTENTTKKENKIIMCYDYPDGITRRLYIRTPFALLLGAKTIDTVANRDNKMRLVVDLKDPVSNSFYNVIEMLDKKMDEYRIKNKIDSKQEKGHHKLINLNKLTTNIIIKKNKTEVISYNISKKYPTEDIGSITYEKLKTIAPLPKYKNSKVNPKYQKEARFIFTPVLWSVANSVVAYKAEIKYRDSFIRSVLDQREEIITHSRVIEIEL